MRKTGKHLEKLVAIVEEVYKLNPSTEIFVNHKIKNLSKNSREFDVFIKTIINEFPINIAIECKEYKTKISTEKIEAFNSKCLRVPEINKKIIVSEKGFQKDAIDAANTFGIELYTFDEIKEKGEEIFLPTKQLKPIFRGFVIIEMYCEPNSLLPKIKMQDVTEYHSIKGDIMSLEKIIEEGVSPNWFQISGTALYQWIKTEEVKQKVRFVVNCSGIFFKYNNEEIFINQIVCDANIEFTFIDLQPNQKMYANYITGEIKAKSLNFKVNNNELDIVVDKNEKLHFFDTSNNQKTKLEVLYTYDKKTDSLKKTK